MTLEAHARKLTAAVVMLAFAAGMLVADYFIGLDICLHVVIVILTPKGLSEFYAMCESREHTPFRKFGMVSAVLLVLLHWAATPGTLSWFGAPAWIEAHVGGELVIFGLVVAVLGALWIQATKRDNDRTFESISSTLFGVLYVWFLASFLVKLRHLGPDGVLGSEGWNHSGTGFLLSCLVISKFTDIGGYLIGRKYGRHKLIPRISPNKTYEGLVGGLAMSTAAAYLLWWSGFLPLGPAWSVAVFAILVGGMGTYGDLAESLLKRGSGRKDSDDLVPGFGGVLDVVDSPLLSAPVAYFLVILLLRLVSL